MRKLSTSILEKIVGGRSKIRRHKKELVEVKGGFADPTVSFFALNDITINKKHRNHFNWKKIFGLK